MLKRNEENMKRQKMRNNRTQKGQSMVEYLVLVVVIILVLLALLRGGKIQRALNYTIEKQGNAMLNDAIKIFR